CAPTGASGSKDSIKNAAQPAKRWRRAKVIHASRSIDGGRISRSIAQASRGHYRWGAPRTPPNLWPQLGSPKESPPTQHLGPPALPPYPSRSSPVGLPAEEYPQMIRPERGGGEEIPLRLPRMMSLETRGCRGRAGWGCICAPADLVVETARLGERRVADSLSPG